MAFIIDPKKKTFMTFIVGLPIEFVDVGRDIQIIMKRDIYTPTNWYTTFQNMVKMDVINLDF